MRSRSPFARRSSIDERPDRPARHPRARSCSSARSLYLIVSERRRHEDVELDNARLLADARIRQDERAQLTDRLITAEQDERRRLALFLHDGPVQNLSGIALMLDAAVQAIAEDRPGDAREIMRSALEKHRDTIRSLRDLSFNIEPVVLRDQGIVPAVQELAEQLGLEHSLQIDVDVEEAERLGEKEQVGLYQIIRESLNQAVLRGPPTRIAVVVREVDRRRPRDDRLRQRQGRAPEGAARRARRARDDAERPLLGRAGPRRRHDDPRRLCPRTRRTRPASD